MTRLRGIREKLNQMRMPELRNVLVVLNLARSGRKIELVDRIASTLESFEAKAAESSVNATSKAFYTNQLNNGLRCIEAQIQASRPHMHAGAHANAYTSPTHAGGLAPPMHYPSPLPSAVPHRSIPSYHSTGQYHSQPVLPPHRPSAPPGLSPLSNGRAGTAALKTPARSLSPDGSMALSPTMLSAAGNARCYCHGESPSGAMVPCKMCQKTFHAKCHQIPATATEWYCELCRADIYDPFYVVKRRVVPGVAVQFLRTPSVFRFSYSVTDREINDMYSKRDLKPGAMAPGSLELQLRCFQLKDELANGTCWPTSTQISVNGFNVPITQRAPPGQANPSKVLRELPANLFPFTRVGSNKVEVRTGENAGVFVFMVHLVEVRDINDLVAEVTLASENITYEQAKQDVVKSFGDEDEDDVVALSTILSVRCPLGLCVISLPARGLHCKHLQCFDLRTFLQFSKKARSKAYRCTVCHNFIKAADLRIDPYLKKLLADVAHDDELEEVEILPDASWRRRITDDAGAASPPAKRLKSEPSETATAAAGEGNSSAPPAAAAPATGTNAAPFEIDLSLSSDEDDDDSGTTATAAVAPAATAAAAAAPTPAPSCPVPVKPPVLQPPGVANGVAPGLLLDDGVSVLTVDSGVWDTTRSTTTSGEMRLANALGASSDMFPFPLDDSIFASLAAPGSSSNGATNGSTWSQLYGSSMPYVPPLGTTTGSQSYGAASSSVWNPPAVSTTSSSGLMQQSHAEVDLASTMAMLSQDTPPVERRPTQPQRSSASMTDPLDIICLLDSDSDTE